jgi:hypothetical protein
MSSCFPGAFAARAAFEHTPYPPTPFHPRQGGKGSLTATFDFVAPGALLRSHGCHCLRVPRFFGYGRNDIVALPRGNGGRGAARVRGMDVGVCIRTSTSTSVRVGRGACPHRERAAPRRFRANPFANTTTAGSPMRAPKHAALPHARNSAIGAPPPNRYSAPLSALARVERGWGIGGELNRSAGKNPGVNT